MTARRTILIGTVLLLGALCANAQTIRFFVNEDTNRIDESTSFDRVAVPTGYTAVAKTVIDAACSCESAMGGFWDGTAYKLPESQKPTTDAGMLRKALRLFRVRLEAMIDDLPRASRHWSAESAVVGSQPVRVCAAGRARCRAVDRVDHDAEARLPRQDEHGGARRGHGGAVPAAGGGGNNCRSR